MRVSRLLFILIFSIILAACASVPQAAVDAAFATLDADLTRFEQVFTDWEHDVANFSVDLSKKLTLSPADQLNGVLEKWCLAINFVNHNKTKDTYSDQKAVFLVSNSGGGWEAQISEDWGTYENHLEDC